MSKQFQLYLLPEDVESLVHTLRSKLDISLIRSSSPEPCPVQLESPIVKEPLMLEKGAVRVDCYLAPGKEADIRMRFIPILAHWSVEPESEAIEFQGCEFDGRVLVRGRFYFANDLLVGDMIAPKRKEFLTWADKVFRLAKKSLHRSTVLNAYVGEQAKKWRHEGGRFAWMVTPQRGPIYEVDKGAEPA
jgi:hypothetical protein